MNLEKFGTYSRRAVYLYRVSGVAAVAKALIGKLRRKFVGARRRDSVCQPGESQPEDMVVNLFRGPSIDFVVFVGVPYDDVGGGQRAARLTRVALSLGYRVAYVYIYDKFDFEKQVHIPSSVKIPGLRHLSVRQTSPVELFAKVAATATVLFDFPHPDFLPYLDFAKKRGMHTVFELIDDWDTSLGNGWFSLDVYHEFVMSTKVVVGTALLLCNKLKALGRADVVYSPNAANERIFDKYRKYPQPRELAQMQGGVALYFGSLYGEWFGWDFVKIAAERNPEMNFVLIGDSPKIDGLPPNVYLLGAKPIEALPAFVAHADLCLLPFVPGKISDAVSPIKIFEYIFMGKPVVSTPLPEVLKYPNVFFADTPLDYSLACAKAIKAVPRNQLEIDQFVSRNGWLQRFESIFNDLNKQKFKNSLDIVILIHNNRTIIGRCLESLLYHGDGLLSKVIVVDNASSDGGGDYVERNFPSVTVIRNDKNGCSSGRNLGAAHSDAEYIGFIDSDQWFTSSQGFLEALTILSSDSSIGAVGWGAGWFDKGRSDFGGMIADFAPDRGMGSKTQKLGYRTDIGYLATCGMFMPRSVFSAAGGFDEFYDPTCFEDTDLSFKIKSLGFRLAFRDLAGVRHEPHQTTKANDANSAYVDLFLRNARYFGNKWASNKDFFVEYSE